MKHPLWVETLRFERAAQEAAYVEYLKEVQHAAERVARLEAAIDPAAMILAAVAPRSRFARPKLPMGRRSE